MNLEKVAIDIQDDILFLTIRKHLLFLHYGKIGMDAEQLYIHLMFTGKMQKTNSVWATNAYLREGLDWSKERLQKAMALLTDLSLAERVTRHGIDGQIEGQYIRVSFKQSPMEITEMIEPSAGNPAGGESTTNALTSNINALTIADSKKIVKLQKKPSAVTEIRNLFASLGIEYYHDGKEAAMCKQLESRYKKDPELFKQYITTLQGMRRTDTFFSKQPLCPSSLHVHWNKIAVQVEKEVPKKTVQPVCYEKQIIMLRNVLRCYCRETEMTDAEIDRAYNDIDLCNREWGKEWREHLTDETKGWLI